MNRICLLVVILVYIAGQFFIGAFSPIEKGYFPDAVFHMDFLNYAAILKQFYTSFPPPNPNFGGIPLTQSWLHHIPGALLSQFISPILSIRIFNFLWIIAFILALRRYFPRDFGILAFLLLCISTPGWCVNPLSLDLIIRSFHHTPVFLFLLIVLFEKSRFLRCIAALLLPWLHGLLALAVFPFFILDTIFIRNREKIFSLLFLTIGIYTYAVFLTRFSAENQIAFFLQKISFKPEEPLTHVLPFIPFLIFCREKRWWLMGGVGFILSSLVQWNNYYFIFVLNVAVALAIIDSLKYLLPLFKRALVMVVIICFIFFIDDLCHKYDPQARAQDPYRAYLGTKYKPALDWISKNTTSKDVFLIYPPDNIQSIPFVMEIRPVYLGWAGFAETLGLKASTRKEKAISFYRGKEIENNIKYIFYGPLEKNHFSDFDSSGYPEVYKDNLVSIYKNQ